MSFLRWLSGLVSLFAIKTVELLRRLIRIAFHVALAMFIIFLIMRAPTMHQNLIRATVGSSVYFVYSKENGGGGTGFAVYAPSGKVFVVTNDHICVNAEKDTVILTNNDGSHKIWAKIIERSQDTDLCLIEAPDRAIGLSLATHTYAGDRVQAVGHPDLMLLTLSNIGEVIQSGPTSLFDVSDVSSKPAPLAALAKCDTKNKKFKIIYGPLGLGPIGCKIEIPDAYFTNVLIQPGNSGSPLVNFYGNVVGVISGVDKYGWGIAVSLEDLRKFLDKR